MLSTPADPFRNEGICCAGVEKRKRGRGRSDAGGSVDVYGPVQYGRFPIAEPFGKDENRQGGINDGTMKTGSLVTSFVNAWYARTRVPVLAVSASKGGSCMKEWQPGSPYLNDAMQRMHDVSNLGCGKAHPIGSIQGFCHVIEKDMQSVIKFNHRTGGLVQCRVSLREDIP